MKQVIFLSIVLTFLSFIINNEEVLAIDGPEIEKLPLTDPALQPAKYCNSEKCNPTIRSLPGTRLDLRKDTKDLYDSMKKDGTKENVVVTLATRLSSIQRLELNQLYNKEGRGSLIWHVKGDNSGRFEDSIIAVLMPVPVYYAEELDKYMRPAGSDEIALAEIFCSINNFGMKAIGSYYEKLYKKNILEEVQKDTTGPFQKVIVGWLQEKRVEGGKVDNARAADDAKALNGPGSKPWKTKPPFTDIIGTRSFPHLRQVFIEYKKISGREIEDDIKKEFPGTESQGFVDITKCIKSRVKFFADKLEESLRHNSGPKMDVPLIRILVTRSEIDLDDIKKEYEKIYKKTLEKAVADKTGSYYRRVLTNLIRGNLAEAAGGAPPSEATAPAAPPPGAAKPPGAAPPPGPPKPPGK